MGQGNISVSGAGRSSSGRVLESDLALASFGHRFAAAIIDHAIIWTMALAAVRIFLPRDFLYRTQNVGVLVIGVSAALLIYYSLSTFLKGRTLGKRLMKIRVIDSRGRRPRLLRALWRESFCRVAMLVSLFIEGIFLIISNMTAYTLSTSTLITYPEYGYRKAKDREPVGVLRFFDRFSGTYVIRTGLQTKN